MGKLVPQKAPSIRKRIARFVAPVLALLAVGAIAFTWLSPTTTSSPSTLNNISQQAFSTTNSASGSATPSGGDLHVYVVGAVKHPGVYVLPAGARVYQLIAAAGGPLSSANLVALNMAAPLTDGEEVYVISNGEIPPTYLGGVPGPGPGSGTPPASGTVTPNGQLVNINTATSDQMRQILHVSSATAQKIIDYRTQHGPYTSVDQLLQVISRSIYDKIRNQVTV
jgi:competence protein ComEA